MNIKSTIETRRIHVFENGSERSFGFVVVLNSLREKTWNKVLAYITQIVKPDYGAVRHLKSITGKDSVHSFSDLVNGARYVACGIESYRKIPRGYHTESEDRISRKKKCSHFYKKVDLKEGNNRSKYWALLQAQKNKRTVIYIFSNGVRSQAAVKFVLTENDLHNWPQLISHMSNMLDKPEGIRSLYTVFGCKVCGPCALQHGGYYVAVAFGEQFEKLDYIKYHQDSLLNKKKNNEQMETFTIDAISSPTHIIKKNDDCFFSKYIEKDKFKSERPKRAPKEKTSDVSSKTVKKKRAKSNSVDEQSSKFTASEVKQLGGAKKKKENLSSSKKQSHISASSSISTSIQTVPKYKKGTKNVGTSKEPLAESDRSLYTSAGTETIQLKADSSITSSKSEKISVSAVELSSRNSRATSSDCVNHLSLIAHILNDVVKELERTSNAKQSSTEAHPLAMSHTSAGLKQSKHSLQSFVSNNVGEVIVEGIGLKVLSKGCVKTCNQMIQTESYLELETISEPEECREERDTCAEPGVKEKERKSTTPETPIANKRPVEATPENTEISTNQEKIPYDNTVVDSDIQSETSKTSKPSAASASGHSARSGCFGLGLLDPEDANSARGSPALNSKQKEKLEKNIINDIELVAENILLKGASINQDNIYCTCNPNANMQTAEDCVCENIYCEKRPYTSKNEECHNKQWVPNQTSVDLETNTQPHQCYTSGGDSDTEERSKNEVSAIPEPGKTGCIPFFKKMFVRRS